LKSGQQRVEKSLITLSKYGFEAIVLRS